MPLFRFVVILFAFSLIGDALLAFTAHAQPPCETGIGRIVSIQGQVMARRRDSAEWTPVHLNDTFCPQDRISTGKNSRIAVVLSNGSVLRVDQETTLVFERPKPEGTFLIDLLKGVAHFFSRKARSLKIDTPFVNGVVEGTEFLVMVDESRTFISLFEGRLLADNAQGSLLLSRGQSAEARAGQPPQLKSVVRPRDAVQWTLYYPPIMVFDPAGFAGALPEELQSRLKHSLAAYHQGDLVQAFRLIDGLGDSQTDARFLVYRAGLSLTVGRVASALADIEKVLAADGGNSDALALRSIVAVVQNRKAAALADARQAVQSSPDSPSALIALSYAHQAHFDLPAALGAVQKATQKAPDHAVARARLAELRLSTGDLDGALKAAQRAAQLNPMQVRAQTVLGYTHLTQMKTEASQAAFEKAIRIDSAAPLPRLGLGLARIRQGHLKDGRAEIEIAAGLDPGNALIRSYLGKAYFDEKREPLEVRQLEIAKELDPMDPTPWFYDAIRKQTRNRPVEALHDLQTSIELNDNRAVYRSRLLLDEDLAARSASLGRIYADLGFQELALRQGWRSLQSDPANYSAHRLLADSYGARQRHEVARVSELLQAQLLQPLTVTPVQPQLAESNLLILEGAGPGSAAFNEFNPLFARNRVAVQADGLAGDNRTWGDEVVLSGLYNRVSASAGQYHYETDGFRENNDLEQDIYDIMVQAALTPKVNVQAEARHRSDEFGDLKFNWDLKEGDTDLRQGQDNDILRAGLHLKPWIHSDVIASVMVLDGTFNVQEGEAEMDNDGVNSELQYLYNTHLVDIIAGGGHYDVGQDLTYAGFGTVMDLEYRHTNGYVYSYLRYPSNITWTIGASFDSLERKRVLLRQEANVPDKRQFNPKLGVNWQITQRTMLRLAAFTGLKRAMVADQTIEPTHVAGFNQFYDDLNATDYVFYGAGIDHQFNNDLHGGAEFNLRKLNVPLVDMNDVEEAWRETVYRLYLYWALNRYFALKLEYQYELFEVDELSTPIPEEMETEIAPIQLSYFHPSGLFSRLAATYVSQDVFDRTYLKTTLRDEFVLVDMAMGYRLPKRYGLLSLEIRNLFDRDFNYQEVIDRSSQDVLAPLFLPDRSIVLQLAISF
jgi:tetratricopeptide (TPR) repeat protein